MRNCISILGLRITEKMLNIFTSIFVTLYLWDLSDGSVPILCKYYIVFVLMAYLSLTFMSFIFLKNKRRKYVLIFGKLLQLSYFILIYVLGTECINNIIMLAAIRGIATGSYYSIHNLYDAEGIDNDIRPRVIGIYGILNGIASVGFPVLAGIVIELYGMQSGLIAAILITCMSILSAILYIDNGKSIGEPFSIKNMFHAIANVKKLRDGLEYAVKSDLCRGFINSYGSFNVFIQVCTMISFGAATQLGYISGISTGFTILFSMIFARWNNKIHDKNIKVYMLLRTLVVASLIGMGITGNIIGLIIMTIALNCSDAIESPIYECGIATLSDSSILSKYKPEFYVVVDTFLVLSRMTGYGLLWLWGTFNNQFMLTICIFIYSIILLITPAAEDKLYRAAYDIKPAKKERTGHGLQIF